MKRKQNAIVEFAPGFLAVGETVHVVGVTSDGCVPLRLETVPGWRERVRLPACSGSECPLESLDEVHERLRRETGLVAEELVVMSRYGIPTRMRGRAAILLAPRVCIPNPAAAGLVVLPLGDVTGFLEDCRRQGRSVDLLVRVGLLMAAKQYPRWAQGRLKRAIEELHWRQRIPETSGASAGAAVRRQGAHA
jgi:hypothetical protein